MFTMHHLTRPVRRALPISAVAALATGLAAIVAMPAAGANHPAHGSCPNPDGGGACLGTLRAGTYETKVFRPRLTYTVPAGWSNFEDLPGNFLLVPPRNTLKGVNAGTSDSIGVYTSIAAAAPGCAAGRSRTVARTPTAIARWIGHHPGLDASTPATASVGGLHGLVLDVRQTRGWKKTCPYSKGTPTVQLISGVRPSGLAHNVPPRPYTYRLYLLARRHATLAIEVSVVSGGSHLPALVAVVKHIRFAV